MKNNNINIKDVVKDQTVYLMNTYGRLKEAKISIITPDYLRVSLRNVSGLVDFNIEDGGIINIIDSYGDFVLFMDRIPSNYDIDFRIEDKVTINDNKEAGVQTVKQITVGLNGSDDICLYLEPIKSYYSQSSCSIANELDIALAYINNFSLAKTIAELILNMDDINKEELKNKIQQLDSAVDPS